MIGTFVMKELNKLLLKWLLGKTFYKFVIPKILNIIFQNFAAIQNNLDSPQGKRYLKFRMQILYMSMLTRCQMIQDLKSQKIRKCQKNGVIRWRQSLVPSLPYKNKTLVTSAKNYPEAVIKAFSFCPSLLDFFTLLLICVHASSQSTSNFIF